MSGNMDGAGTVMGLLNSEDWSLMSSMQQAARDFDQVPCAYRPVVTHPDALVSSKRGCPDPTCPVCQSQATP